jgi:4-hydroxythreonine-4-phosphate dehydrogenase
MQPLLALTMGDPCGIGPEIVAMQAVMAAPPAVVVGSVAVMRRAVSALRQMGHRAGHVSIRQVGSPQEAQAVAHVQAGELLVWEPLGLPVGLEALPWGQVSGLAGVAAAACVRAAAQCCLDGRAAAMVTAPLHKEALALAGEPFPGHTELLQAMATPPGQPLLPVRMMLANHELKTVLVSIHVSLRQAIDAVTFDQVLQTLTITDASLRRLGVAHPRIGVAGLNPHAGEGGLFGDEELRIIGPAIEAARAAGVDARGPFAPDTVFMRARHAPGHPGEFDAVVAMYHDQGLIPVKYLGVAEGVNVTLGLPWVRTSPDHGTAFDLAGQGRADPSSLIEAMVMARSLGGFAAA